MIWWNITGGCGTNTELTVGRKVLGVGRMLCGRKLPHPYTTHSKQTQTSLMPTRIVQIKIQISNKSKYKYQTNQNTNIKKIKIQISMMHQTQSMSSELYNCESGMYDGLSVAWCNNIFNIICLFVYLSMYQCKCNSHQGTALWRKTQIGRYIWYCYTNTAAVPTDSK